jgi:branched-chain amino acid aminotransferase
MALNENRLIWLSGKLVAANEANINVLSPTSQFGTNVFEGIRCYWNQSEQQLYAFRLRDHLERLMRSVKMIRFEEKYTYDELEKAFIDTVKANEYKEDIAVRQTIFLDGTGSWFALGPTGMFIAPIPKKRLHPEAVKGISACVSSWERINDNSMSPRIKVGANYVNSRAGQLEAIRNGYGTALFLNNQGKVSEGPGSCLFIVRDNKLITPPPTASVLESITRASLDEIARSEMGLSVEERDIDRTELYIADELFRADRPLNFSPLRRLMACLWVMGD